MLKDNSIVTIGGHTYQFHNRINSEPKLLADFNQLAKTTFGIQFQSVGNEYEPHVLTDGHTVCANVSVNLQLLKRSADDEVILGFTPKIFNNLICRKHKEKNTTLFVKQCGENQFELKKQMFPVISHA